MCRQRASYLNNRLCFFFCNNVSVNSVPNSIAFCQPPGAALVGGKHEFQNEFKVAPHPTVEPSMRSCEGRC